MDVKLLPARINDLISLCEKTSVPKFLGFLTPAEAAVAKSVLKSSDRYTFFGGYIGAERTVLAIMPDWCDTPDFPITAITFTYRMCDKLSHRDFLGALMSLGLNRETVGDILIQDGKAVVFVLSDVLNFVLSQISKIGSVGVQMQIGYTEPLPCDGKIENMTDTVASMRVDCIIASVCGFSRNMAAQVIADGRVTVNSICISKATAIINAGDTVTVRQKGRFKIISCDEYSKKGRIILKYNKYI